MHNRCFIKHPDSSYAQIRLWTSSEHPSAFAATATENRLLGIVAKLINHIRSYRMPSINWNTQYLISSGSTKGVFCPKMCLLFCSREIKLYYNIFHRTSTQLNSCSLDTTGQQGRTVSENHHLPAYRSKQIPVTYRTGHDTQRRTGWSLHLPAGLLPKDRGGFFPYRMPRAPPVSHHLPPARLVMWTPLEASVVMLNSPKTTVQWRSLLQGSQYRTDLEPAWPWAARGEPLAGEVSARRRFWTSLVTNHIITTQLSTSQTWQ